MKQYGFKTPDPSAPGYIGYLRNVMVMQTMMGGNGETTPKQFFSLVGFVKNHLAPVKTVTDPDTGEASTVIDPDKAFTDEELTEITDSFSMDDFNEIFKQVVEVSTGKPLTSAGSN